jgi:GTP cyclohydrolase I
MELINNGLGDNRNGGYDRVDRWNEETTNALTEHFSEVLNLLGEDAQREGLKETPRRMAKSMLFLTQGYGTDPADILKSTIFHEDYSEMVIVKDIELFSMCEHHMLPFIGKAHVAYIPNGRITGLSKIARVVDGYARRLQVQERLTVQIRDCIQDTLKPMGVAVVIEALHLCMVMRGVQKQHSVTTTSAFTGAFMNSDKTREEFIHLIGNNLH